MNDTYLDDFKTQLKNLAKDSLSYTRLLRKMEDFGNTIEINLYNYNETIQQICGRLEIDKEELSFLKYFGQETAPHFQRQIKADLGYFEHGTDLIEQAIASIRGIVEIDQAERDRALENQIQTVGIAIAAGAIVASTSALIFEEPITFPWQEYHGDRLHPFMIAVLVSMGCAIAFWALAKWVLPWIKPKIFRKK